MTNEERLAKIKHFYNHMSITIPRRRNGKQFAQNQVNNIMWLIERAELADRYEMKYENSGAIFSRQHMQSQIDKLEEKVKRYEKAIEDHTICQKCNELIRETLEGEK